MKPQPKNNSKVIKNIARFLWRSHADGGEMVGNFEEQTTYWNNEARKILRIITRCNK